MQQPKHISGNAVCRPCVALTSLAALLRQVSRYYSFFIVNMVAPIILTTMLGFFVFLLGVEDMEKRLGERFRKP